MATFVEADGDLGTAKWLSNQPPMVQEALRNLKPDGRFLKQDEFISFLSRLSPYVTDSDALEMFNAVAGGNETIDILQFCNWAFCGCPAEQPDADAAVDEDAPKPFSIFKIPRDLRSFAVDQHQRVGMIIYNGRRWGTAREDSQHFWPEEHVKLRWPAGDESPLMPTAALRIANKAEVRTWRAEAPVWSFDPVAHGLLGHVANDQAFWQWFRGVGVVDGCPPSPKSAQHLKSVLSAFTFKGAIEKAEHRATSFLQMLRVLAVAAVQSPKWHDTAPPEQSANSGKNLSLDLLSFNHFNSWVVQPCTRKHKCSFVELLTDRPQPPSWFVSHWWGDVIRDFILAIAYHMRLRRLTTNDHYWVCAWAIRQRSSKGPETLEDPTQTSFYKALQLSRGILLVCDEEKAECGWSPLSRSWCAFEELCAAKERKPCDIAVICDSSVELLTDGLAESDTCTIPCDIEGDVRPREVVSDPSYLSIASKEAKTMREQCFPLSVLCVGVQMRIESSTATSDADRQRILNAVASRDPDEKPLEAHESYVETNNILRAKFALWGWRQFGDQGCVEELDLPAIVFAAGPYLSAVCLNFGECVWLDDAGAKQVAAALHPEVPRVSLYLGGCTDLTDAGLIAITANIPKHAKELWLCLGNLPKPTAVTIAALAERLPDGLHSLELDFRDNAWATDVAFAMLAAKLPRALREFRVWCKGSAVTQAGLAALADGLPNSVSCLAVVLDKRSICSVEELRRLRPVAGSAGETGLPDLDSGAAAALRAQALELLQVHEPVP